MNKLFSILYIVFCGSIISQETPGAIQQKSMLLLDGTAHVGNGKVIKRAAIGIKNGKIIMVENSLIRTIDTSKYDEIIHIKGKHVYPGFITCNSTLGLMDVGAVRASRDLYEVGEYNPNIRSIIAYNTDSKITTTVRTNGVLMGQICPKGGVISGSSSLVQFDAWNWEDALIKADEGIHLNWPRYYNRSKKDKAELVSQYQKRKEEVIAFFNRSLAYSKENQPKTTNIKLKAMKGLFDGSKQLYIHANYIKEITDIITFKKEYNINKLCIIGGYDSWMIAKRLKENNISVMLPRIHSLPKNSHDNIHLPYKLPALLAKAEVLFCIQNSGDMQEMITRNLPFMVGTAIAYGLDYEDGVASITLNAAKILGVDENLGSLELGKDATLFVSKGDAFDIKSNKVELALINGRIMSLDNDQIRNYKKYKNKFGLD